jgi:hypothetical protein
LLTHSRIVSLTGNNRLQVSRSPDLRNNADGSIVTDLAGAKAMVLSACGDARAAFKMHPIENTEHKNAAQKICNPAVDLSFFVL